MFGVFFVWMWVAFNPSHAVDPIAYRWNENVVVERTYDTDSDDSFQKFLDKEHPFSVITYEPNDLKVVESDFTANNSNVVFAWRLWQYKYFNMDQTVKNALNLVNTL